MVASLAVEKICDGVTGIGVKEVGISAVDLVGVGVAGSRHRLCCGGVGAKGRKVTRCEPL